MSRTLESRGLRRRTGRPTDGRLVRPSSRRARTFADITPAGNVPRVRSDFVDGIKKLPVEVIAA